MPVKTKAKRGAVAVKARRADQRKIAGRKAASTKKFQSAAMTSLKIVSNKGFSHVGLSTLDLDKTRAFYEDILGFKAVVADTLRIREGGLLRHIFFDVGRGQLLAFMEPRDMPGVSTDYDTGINRGLGVPAAFYHFAFEAGSEAALAAKRDQLRTKGLNVTDIVDHGWAKSIYFKDPNGLSLEYCCTVRDLTKDDAVMQERGTISRAALEMGDEGSDENSRVQSVRAKVTA